MRGERREKRKGFNDEITKIFHTMLKNKVKILNKIFEFLFCFILGSF